MSNPKFRKGAPDCAPATSVRAACLSASTVCALTAIAAALLAAQPVYAQAPGTQAGRADAVRADPAQADSARTDPSRASLRSLDEVVVTATARPEARSRIAGTTQVIGREAIEYSAARSVTDLLAENAVGFFSEWTAAQTSINIRGAATDGQGRDFRSQVLVLINGRRAGTANLSKLSPGDVERIEIVRGPSSVLYGSQNMGGVINVIMKSGVGEPGSRADLRAGSWGQYQTQVQTRGNAGATDWYLGLTAGSRDDHDSGLGNRMLNSSWKRRGASGAFGWQVNELNRLDLNVRVDGIYDAGFRGSGANYTSKDDRYNGSVDLVYDGNLANNRVGWMAHAYHFRDVDQFNWASRVVRSGTQPVPGTSRDYNHRQLGASGLRLQTRLGLTDSNQLLVGYDGEHSRLRSDRERLPMPGTTVSQLAPYDYNQTERVHALYFEDAQDFLADRLTLRGGVRKTWGRTSFDETPHLAGQNPAARRYDATTWSLGATFRASRQLSLRALAATGFRAPTASELAADFTAVGGGRVFGNADLKPEKARQIEVGATWTTHALRVDTALFQNIITDRIRTVSRGPETNTSDYGNNPDEVVARGLEASVNVRLNEAFDWRASAPTVSVFSSGYYHFEMKDKGAVASANTRQVQRMYRYELAAGVRYGRGGDWQPDAWQLQLAALLRGPMWYDTEEAMLVPLFEPNSTFIHRKGAFTVWNLRGDYQVNRHLKLYAAVNNLLDKNEHPIYLAVDRGDGCLADVRFQNGGCGTSMPGREFQIGVQGRF